jgi:hypothetical protein
MDSLEWTINDTNAGFLSLDEDTGNLSGTPGDDDVGTWWVNITLEDGMGGHDWINLSLSVLNINDPPELNQTSVSLEAEEDSGAITLDLNDVFMDSDEDSLTFGYSVGENFTVSIVDGVATITPKENFSGSETIEFTADDGETEISINVSLEVTAVNDAPSGVTVNQPSDYKEGQDQTVTASATDPDGDTLTYTWSSNVSGEIGTGSEINLSLPAGPHTITLVVTDGSGGSVTYTFDIDVQKVEGEGDGDGEDDEFPWLIVIIVVIVLIVVGIILFLVMSKKKEDEDSQEMTGEPSYGGMEDEQPLMAEGYGSEPEYPGEMEGDEEPFEPEEEVGYVEEPSYEEGMEEPSHEEAMEEPSLEEDTGEKDPDYQEEDLEKELDNLLGEESEEEDSPLGPPPPPAP